MSIEGDERADEHAAVLDGDPHAVVYQLPEPAFVRSHINTNLPSARLSTDRSLFYNKSQVSFCPLNPDFNGGTETSPYSYVLALRDKPLIINNPRRLVSYLEEQEAAARAPGALERPEF